MKKMLFAQACVAAVISVAGCQNTPRTGPAAGGFGQPGISTARNTSQPIYPMANGATTTTTVIPGSSMNSTGTMSNSAFPSSGMGGSPVSQGNFGGTPMPSSTTTFPSRNSSVSPMGGGDMMMNQMGAPTGQPTTTGGIPMNSSPGFPTGAGPNPAPLPSFGGGTNLRP